MIKPAENIFVRPLFFSALTGEIRPLIDEQRRTHTLGHLSIATFTQGELTIDPEDEELISYVYRPSWAPEVESRVFCETDDNNNPTHLVSAELSLPSSERPHHGLCIIDALLSDRGRGLIIIDDNDDKFMSLHLGDELTAARQAVAQSALDFFDKVAS